MSIDALLQKVNTEVSPRSFRDQVEALENWCDIIGIKYASDESMAEAVLSDYSLSQAMSRISVLKSTKKAQEDA